MAVLGYVRLDRDDDQQQNDISVLDIDRIYEDRGSSRDGLAAALRSAVQGDCLVVVRLSQFRLNVAGMLKLAAALRFRGIHLASLSENLDTRSTGRSMLGWEFFQTALLLLAMERGLARERAEVELLTIGPPRGRKGGRRPKLSPAQVIEAKRALWSRGNAKSIKVIADSFGVARSTFYETVIDAPEPDWLNLNC